MGTFVTDWHAIGVCAMSKLHGAELCDSSGGGWVCLPRKLGRISSSRVFPAAAGGLVFRSLSASFMYWFRRGSMHTSAPR